MFLVLVFCLSFYFRHLCGFSNKLSFRSDFNDLDNVSFVVSPYHNFLFVIRIPVFM